MKLNKILSTRIAHDKKGLFLYRSSNSSNLIKIPFDDAYDYAFTMGGDKGKVYRADVQYDANYKAVGYSIYFKCNGSLFYKDTDGLYKAEGIEKIEGVQTQESDVSFNDDMACVVVDNKLIFDKQYNIIGKYLNNAYCGLTGMGILLNGQEFTHHTFAEWNVRSGRTIIGTDRDGNFMSYQFAGTTGKTGKTGPELVQICKDNGFYNALLLDGGGSVYREFNGQKLITTTRAIKNTFIIYRRKKTDPTDYKDLYEKEKVKTTRLSEKIANIKNICEED